ncbi:biotin/lipoyl-binding protein, partial [uncultured Salinisphaera sp.]
MSRMPTIRPIWIVLIIVVVLAAWLASGMVGGGEPTGETAPKADQAQPVSVAVRTSTAEQVWREVELNGRTAPDRAVTLRAQTAGRIDSISARRGARVKAGEVLARIALDDRGASRNEARAV